MPGRPFQSKLKSYKEEIRRLLAGGHSYRDTARLLNRSHGLSITHNAVFSFVRSHQLSGCRMLFYEGLDADIRDQLLKQVTAEWTHDSTAIEGNTLSLGDTVKILELGLTISGKPLREHQEVYGHARAIDVIYGLLKHGPIRDEHLFDLHRAVMQQVPIDSLNPVGAWKRDYNGTTGVIDGKSVYMEFAAPDHVPRLMTRWLDDLNSREEARSSAEVIRRYVEVHMTFVRIHPFFDGNGRLARLLANVPVLRSGFPPITIPSDQRGRYIDLLWSYQNDVGILTPSSRLLPSHPAIRDFSALVREIWKKTLTLSEQAHRRQKLRQQKRHGRL